jgi:asparagine synthase (glutamine-hydrolysing)
MCGICGFNWRDEKLIEDIKREVKHRGPDGDGTFADDEVTLGHVRLSVIDLSEFGKQPMQNEDGSMWIVFNGEVYNYADLRNVLIARGHRFKSNSDTEVVVHAYEDFGQDCVELLDGMWAFAIYDRTRKCLFLSRDRFGIKPLHYVVDSGKFLFCSEIKGILRSDVPRTVNEEAVHELLAYGLTDCSRETFFKGVFRLMPGENLLYDLTTRSLKLSKWYDSNKRLRTTKQIEKVGVPSQLRDRFIDSVRSHLVSDVPVGSCLSGGIDSSAVVCGMRELERSSRIETFSLVFPGMQIDESRYVEAIVDFTGAKTHKVSPSEDDLIRDMEDLVWTQEEPFQSPSVYGQYKVMELASSNKVKVLLDGQGGDEILAGYPYYLVNYLLESISEMRVKGLIDIMVSRSLSPSVFLRHCIVVLMDMVDSSRSHSSEFRQRRSGFSFLSRTPKVANYPFSVSASLDEELLLDLTVRNIPRLLRYEDRNSMRWGVETRVPYLDHRFVEFVFSIPSAGKVRNGILKSCFREALKGLVPDSVLSRRDKIGFAAPDSEWLRSNGMMKLCREVFSSSSFARRPYWKKESVDKMLKDHLAGKRDWSNALWGVLLVEIWHRVFIDDYDMKNRSEPGANKNRIDPLHLVQD